MYSEFFNIKIMSKHPIMQNNESNIRKPFWTEQIEYQISHAGMGNHKKEGDLAYQDAAAQHRVNPVYC